MDIEAHPFDLRECVESALDLVGARAASKAARHRLRFEGDVPPAIERRRDAAAPGAAEPAAQRGQVHRAGRSRAHGRRASAGESGHAACCSFAVRDTGIGLAPRGMSRLFQSFSQADASTTRKLRRHRARAGHQQAPGRADGRHDVGRERRVPGQGSTFHFTIDAAGRRCCRRAGARLRRRRSRRWPGKRLLVVDDNATNRRILVAADSTRGA